MSARSEPASPTGHCATARTLPADGVPRADARDAQWVAPTLVGEVAFRNWTPDGRLRHPSWRGIRTDKTPAQVILPAVRPT